MSRTGEQPATPRAVIHKRILEAAESEPNASMAEIADGIGGASTDLVERVLDEYGDPSGEPDVQDDAHERAGRDDVVDADGRNGAGSRDGEDGSTGSGGEDGRSGADGADTGTHEHEHGNGTGASASTRDASEREMMKENGRADGDHPDLSEGQLRALRLVERNPGASQGEIAEEFDVTRATISRWLNDVPGFEWSRRAELAPRILNGDTSGTVDDPTAVDESSADGTGTGTRETDGSESSADGSEPSADEPEPSPGTSEPPERPASERPRELDSRLERIERRLDRLENGTGAGRSAKPESNLAGIDPELAHRVVHASMRSDRITEEEELRLLKELLG